MDRIHMYWKRVVNVLEPAGDWVALLRDNGFSIERLLELQAPPNARSRFPWANPDWARRWPSEEAWVVRKT